MVHCANVASEIRVCASGRTASDAEIARRAPVVIAWHAHIPDGAVAVQVDNGWVTLAGMVEDAFEREAAETGVRRLDGVVGVTNLIETRTASGDGACSCSQSNADEFRASAANDEAVLQSPAPWRSGVLEQIAGWLRS